MQGVSAFEMGAPDDLDELAVHRELVPDKGHMIRSWDCPDFGIAKEKRG